jgi:diguanylate cyclase (GGDEF)-like protein
MLFSSTLDLPTLLIVSASLAALIAFFLLFAWLRDNSLRSLVWRNRRRPSGARSRLVTVPLLHAAIILSPIMLHISVELFVLETVIYSVALGFVILLMMKDCHVQIHKTAASTDPLTGLFNRRGFFEAAEELRARAARRRQPISVLMFDLDKFKSINDRFGHAIGDDVIQRFAHTAGGSLRSSDIVGRLGGEEFAAIVPGGRNIAEMIGERVRANFQIAGVQFHDLRINATVSIGAACASDTLDDLNVLLERADAALYRAKKQGRNRVQVSEAEVQHPVVRHIAAARAANMPTVISPGIASADGENQAVA